MQPEPVIAAAWAAAWPPLYAVLWPRLTRGLTRARVSFWGCWIGAAVWLPGVSALGGYWLAAVIGIIGWWLSRRRKRRAPALRGAKSRALLAAVVAKLRESLKPRPVLRPLPGGAR